MVDERGYVLVPEVSLLDRGDERVLVFLEEVSTDEDGNTITRPSPTGIPALARISLQNQSGTSSRRAEQDNEGFESESVYSVKFPRSFPYVLGAQSQIEWRGKRWVVFGDARLHLRSPRTAHTSYVIKRY